MLSDFDQRLASEVEGLDPTRLAGQDAERVVAATHRIERRLAALRLRCAARAADAKTWKAQGFRTPEEWLARKTGVGVGQARRALETGRRLGQLPEVAQAASAGELSEQQAEKVTEAAASDPDSQGSLLSAAKGKSFRELDDECRKVKARSRSASEERARLAAIHEQRKFVSWTDEATGAFRFSGSATPDAGARLLSAIARVEKEIFSEARSEGRRESPGAYRLDALLRLAESGGPPSRAPRAEIFFHVDTDALRALAEGEEGSTGAICELAGVGPVPLRILERYFGTALAKVIFKTARDVQSVSHPGRYRSAHLETAVRARDRTCVVEGCGQSTNLEIHHVRGVEEGGPTELENLCLLCAHHHDLVTYDRYRLDKRRGRWGLVPPEERCDANQPDSGAGSEGGRGSPRDARTDVVESEPRLFDSS